MDGEYLLTTTIAAGDTAVMPIPAAGIAGVYSTSAILLKWDFNGVIAELKSAAEWEPLGGFHPAPTSKLILDNSSGGSAVTVAVRCYPQV